MKVLYNLQWNLSYKVRKGKSSPTTRIYNMQKSIAVHSHFGQLERLIRSIWRPQEGYTPKIWVQLWAYILWVYIKWVYMKWVYCTLCTPKIILWYRKTAFDMHPYWYKIWPKILWCTWKNFKLLWQYFSCQKTRRCYLHTFFND